MNGLTRATAAVLTDAEGRVLLIRLGDGPRRQWSLPGGELASDEPPDAALTRDVERTTGSPIRVVDLVGLYHLGGAEHLPDLLTYVFRCEVVGRRPESVPYLGWHPRRRVPTPVTRTACAVLTDTAAGRAGLVRHLQR